MQLPDTVLHDGAAAISCAFNAASSPGALLDSELPSHEVEVSAAAEEERPATGPLLHAYVNLPPGIGAPDATEC
jgi:hypothetical protein